MSAQGIYILLSDCWMPFGLKKNKKKQKKTKKNKKKQKKKNKTKKKRFSQGDFTVRFSWFKVALVFDLGVTVTIFLLLSSAKDIS